MSVESVFVVSSKEETVNKTFYLVSVAVGGFLGTLFGAVGLIPLGFVLGLFAGIVALVMWYKAWEAIQDEHSRTTPGKAVGFLFIPFFNLYWIFQAFWGFAKDFNSYLGRRAISISQLPEGLFLAYCIMLLVAMVMQFIPIVGSVVGFVNWIILILIVNAVCDGVNGLPEKTE